MGVKVVSRSPAPGGIPPATVDAKGDLLVGGAADTVARLPVSGTNGRVLSENSDTPTGLEWVDQGGGAMLWTTTSAVMFVDKGGSDANSGRAPWAAKATIQAGVDAVPTGGHLRIGAGGYTETVTIPAGKRLRMTGVFSDVSNTGTRIHPPAEDASCLVMADVDDTEIEHVSFRNQLQANYRGVLVYLKNCSRNVFRGCKWTNNETVCSPDDGSKGGTGLFMARGERNRVYDYDFSSLHLALHLGREVAQTYFGVGKSASNYHELIIDNDAGPITDDYTSYQRWGFMTGDTSIMDASAGSLAALSAGSAQTVRFDTLLSTSFWVPLNARQTGSITTGTGDGFGFTARSRYITVEAAGTQNPANGGTLRVTSASGAPPTAGVLFWSDNEAITYTNSVLVSGTTYDLESITRGALGTGNQGSLGNGIDFQIPTGDCLLGRYNETDGLLQIGKIVAGVFTELASTPLVLASGTPRWLDFEVEDNGLRLAIFLADPRNPGDPFWPVGAGGVAWGHEALVEHTLTGADATAFGAGVAGYVGHRLDATNTAWRLDNSSIHAYAGPASGGGQFIGHKATTNPRQKDRTGADLHFEDNLAEHRSEFNTFTLGGQFGTNTNVYLGTDYTEGFQPCYHYWGDRWSTWIRAVSPGRNQWAGDYNLIDFKTTGGDERSLWIRPETVGNRVLSHKGTHATYEGRTVLEHADGTMDLERAIKDWITLGPEVDTPALRNHSWTRPALVGRWYGNDELVPGATETELVLTQSGGVANGRLVVIEVGFNAWLDAVRIGVASVSAPDKSARLTLYQIDPRTKELLTPSVKIAEVANAVMVAQDPLELTFTPVRGQGPYIGVLLHYGGTGGAPSATFKALQANVGTSSPYGRADGASVASAPPIALVCDVPSGAAPDTPVFNASKYATVAPIVQLRRSA